MLDVKDFNRVYLDILNDLSLLSISYTPGINFSPDSEFCSVLDSLDYQVRYLRRSLVIAENDLFK